MHPFVVHPAMLKFWKKKPPVENPPLAKANEVLLAKARATPHSVTEEVPVAALLARTEPVTLIKSLKAHPEMADDERRIDLTVTEERAVDPRLLEASQPMEAERPAKKSWRERLAGSGFAKGLGGLASALRLKLSTTCASAWPGASLRMPATCSMRCASA